MPAAVLACAALLAISPGAARAQFFGQSGPLGALEDRGKSVGVFLGAGRGNIGPMAELRSSYSDRGTLGLQITSESKIFGIAADVRTALVRVGGDYPFDLGGQLAGGIVSGGGQTGIIVSGVPGASVTWDPGVGQKASLFAGLGFRLTISTKRVGQGDGMWRIGGRLQYTDAVGLMTSVESVGGSAHLLVGGDIQFGGGAASSNVPPSSGGH